MQRIWRQHGLQPMCQFKLSNDKQFPEKLRDVVGLYIDPPDHSVVLSFDEKSQVQALNIHVVLDNNAAHKHPKVMAWLGRHPRLHLPFYANLRILAQLRRRLFRRPHKVKRDPNPLTWTKDPEKIIAAVKRGRQMLDSS